VGLACAILTELCPEEGWHIGGQTVRLTAPAGWSRWLGTEPLKPVIPQWRPEDVEALLNLYEKQLSAIEAQDSLRPDSADVHPDVSGPKSSGLTPSPPPVVVEKETAHPQPTGTSHGTAALSVPDHGKDWIPGSLRIRIPDESQPAYHRLFARLASGKGVQVLHYGDSQIEGDRISGALRRRWQDRWGGFGPGIQPPVPLVQSFALTQKLSGKWRRHARYGLRDTTDLDEHYGLLASYATAETEDGLACIEVGRERRSPISFGQWTHLELWHDTVHARCIVSTAGVPVDTLFPGAPPGTLSLPNSGMKPEAPSIDLCFEGSPPRLFALHPVGKGVQWHSIAMRGSSGTLFRKLSRATFSNQLRTLDPDLIVLQFGGNTVPYTLDSSAAERYGGWFKRQIELFQQLAPQAAILVIGPSDMAEKTGLEWTSFPQLDAIRWAIRNASLDAGVAHWDLLEAMGGLGSMPAWVASTPPLAGPDHVHFTPRGAKQVGEWLDRAIWAEYRRWERGGDRPAMSGMKPRPLSTLSLQIPEDNER